MIPPGAQLGVLGGGQLGMFFTIAAKRLGYQVVVWDPDADAPARSWADRFVCAPFDNSDALRDFLLETSGVTFEREAIPVDLVASIAGTVLVRPGSRALRVLQNRVTQKRFLAEHGLPVPAWRALYSPQALPQVAAEVAFPCVCKVATSGYDGRGQWRLPDAQAAATQAAALAAAPRASSDDARWIVEAWIPFRKELSVVVVRSEGGDIVTYPVAENVHEDGVLRTSRVPAELGPALAANATALASRVVTKLGDPGVFCVEMFEQPDHTLVVNEVAPRPHNSGHYTMDVCTASQFEQQVRIVCGLPLVQPQLLSPAVMVNVLGNEIDLLHSPKAVDLLSLHDARVYDYRKRSITAGRKMAHVVLVDPDPLRALDRAGLISNVLTRSHQLAKTTGRPASQVALPCD